MEEILNLVNKVEVFIKKHFGDDINPEDILNRFKDEKSLNIHLESIKTSSFEQFRNLASISALCATLLIVATFNDKIIHYSFIVKIILSVLLLIIIFSISGYFLNFNIQKNKSFKEVENIAKKNDNKELLEKIKKIREENKKKYWYLSYLPFISTTLIDIIIVVLIVLIWVR